MFQFYGLPFLISFLISLFCCYLFIKFFKKNKYRNRNSERHIHKNKDVTRIGGLGFSISFILTLFINSDIVLDEKILIMCIGSFLILLLGLLDDFWELNWKIQLLFQFVIIFVIFILGIQIDFITNPLGGIIPFNLMISFIFTFIWILIIVNVVNWIDGIDGLMGGVIFFASISLFFLSLRADVNQPPLAIISIILVGSVLGFLFFNFPPAKIFAGSNGSFFVGYLIAVLAIFAGAKIGTTLLVLSVPLTDAFFVIWQRWKNKQSFFKADTRHLHHQLLKLGWSQKKIVIFYYFITAVGVAVALSTNSISKLFAFILFFVSAFIFCFVLNKEVDKLKNI